MALLRPGAPAGLRSATRARDLVVVQGTMGSYRDGFVDELLRRRPSTALCCGPMHFDPTVVLSPAIAARSTRLRNRFLLRRRLLWQSGATRTAAAARCAVLELNPRIVNVWLLLVWRRLAGRRTVVWGHAWPRGGRQSRTVVLRRAMVRLADAALMYTPEDAADIGRSTGRPAFVAPNAVTSRGRTQIVPGAARDVLQIGRLVPEKRPMLTLEAWLAAAQALPAEARLIFAGGGPESAALQARAAQSPYADRVAFLGHVSDDGQLAQIFADSLVSVSAGYAGLSITQSFAFGVPAIIADDEPHAPEITLATADNSVRFTARDAAALAATLREVYAQRSTWLGRRTAISETTLRAYSVEAMVDGLLEAVDA